MSTSWTPMLAHFNPGLQQYGSRVPCPCTLMMVYEFALPLNLASREIVCTEWNQQFNGNVLVAGKHCVKRSNINYLVVFQLSVLWRCDPYRWPWQIYEVCPELYTVLPTSLHRHTPHCQHYGMDTRYFLLNFEFYA